MYPSLLQFASAVTQDQEELVKQLSTQSVLFAALILIILLVASTQLKDNRKKSTKQLKKLIFAVIIVVVIAPTLFLAGSTVWLNTISESGGPVHWHTDIEYWVCGHEVELKNPSGFLSNKIGTSTFHEHDDKRLHLEGVVLEKYYDASLEKFMDVIDGKISNEEILIPLDKSIFENDTDADQQRGDKEYIRSLATATADPDVFEMNLTSGKTDCGNGIAGEVQAFLYTYNKDSDTYYQRKLDDPARYTMRDEPNTPPADCLIVEFDVKKDRTDRLCKQYGVKDVDRCTEFTGKEFDERFCNIREVEGPTEQGGDQ